MEEISLRELIEIVLKGKWIIAIITAICMMVSVIASFFIIKPTYEAQTTLMISPIVDAKSNNTEDNKFFGLVGALSQYPQMTIDTYREQIKTSSILSKVAGELGNTYDWTDIAKKITISNAKNTNLLTVAVKDTSPAEAAKIANLVSQYFSDFVSETTQKQAEHSASFIKEQQDKEKANLDKAMGELKKFISQPRGPEELKLELESKLKQLTEFKTKVLEVKIDEQSAKMSVEKGKAILQNTSKTITTNKTLSSDELMNSVVKDQTGTDSVSTAGLKLTNEELNDSYIKTSEEVNKQEMKLAELSAKRQAIEQEIASRQKEIDNMQAEYADKQQKLDVLDSDVKLIKQTYEAYQQKYKEAIIKQSAEVGKSSIVVLAQALEPSNPVAPQKVVNVAIAMVLGIMVGVFIVFVKEYWMKSALVVQKEQATL